MVLNPVIGKLVSKRVVLASASPRRQEILTNVGLRFEVVPSWFKETLEKSSFAAPYEYAIETAKQKALEVANRMHLKHLRTPDIVIGADTIVTVGKQILEKPVDKQDAYKMLSRLSGKEHSVFTGVAIVHCSSKDNHLETEVTDFYEETKVKFAELSEELLWEYIHSGEPMDKAGGYGIQALGGMLVEYVHGDFLNVVGFPLNHFCKKLAELYYPPLKHTIQHVKHDSIPSVETFENLSDGESDSSNPMQHKSANKLERNGVPLSGAIHTPVNSGSIKPVCTVAVENQSGVMEYPAKFPSKILELMDGFRASKRMASFSGCTSDPGCRTSAHSSYSNTDSANTYLVSDREYSLHGYIIHCNDRLWHLFTHLEAAVKEGTMQTHQAFGKETEDLFQDSCYHSVEAKQRFMTAMHSIAKLTARDVATSFDLSPFRSVCDLGGCTGVLAHELVQKYPNLNITVFDLPDVIANVSCFQPSGLHITPVMFTAGDFFKDNLPEADLYILSLILHDLNDEKIHILLSKISSICKPGCGILLAKMVLDDEKKRRSTALLQSLNMLVQIDGKERNSSEYRCLLEHHGFTNVEIKLTGNVFCFLH
ncbi:probable bifunctional dTTP/UTP pyrophosphatase/methyltransferase protein [Terrapene carolina triunguis]|uniref:probable bifunctional dTTP/UTP pyrophosphatase/methyltransferase protein n=1 Tax=Terrapene triunguis TaxID=2587831 RepID=UPI000E77622D|nr:probable bifunctional dTTP/UTP pyrophosphatase/methyltransferase protein [Terrapene carolina triunguis]